MIKLQNTPNSFPMDDANKKFWSLPAKKAVEFFQSSFEGIPDGQAVERLRTYGRNILPKGHVTTKFELWVRQFKSPLIVVLIAAGLITAYIGDYVESLFIFFAVLVNAALGFYQENKAEQALSKLRSYIREVVRVMRGGTEREIDAEEVVPGDIIRLFPGGRVPADARVIEANNLSADESIITGESLPSQKSVEPVSEEADIVDQNSMVFAGTLVTDGLGLAVVTATGADTELGKIAKLVSSAEHESTPLQKAIAKFTRTTTLILGVLTALLFTIGIYSGIDPVEMFIISVAVAVAAVPEGLPIALTVVLAVGVLRLAKKHGVVRRLMAAETLGSTTIVMTDKTGTLTEAKMKLSEIISEHSKKEIIEYALINADVIVENAPDGKGELRIIGRPLEIAIMKAAIDAGIALDERRWKFKVLDRQPFNSTDKFSGVYVDDGRRKFWNYLGAPDILVIDSDLSHTEKEKLLAQIDQLAYAGNRVLALVQDKKFLGLLAFRDPVRPSVKDSIRKIAHAGVKTVVVTGDHRGTALAIARESGIEATDREVLTGEELRKMPDDELRRKLASIKIFARVIPEDKLRIARLYQERGEVVAMTGDGVNDAPALKEADIGIAVGGGTDVAKGAADLVLLDDNFETIVSAIEEGRRIVENIKKVVVYLFSSLLDELILIVGAILLGVPLPLTALQILWINFLLDSFPAVALAFEHGIDHLKAKPSKLHGRLFDPVMRFLVVVIGVTSSFLLLGFYLYGLKKGVDPALIRTFIFAAFSLFTLFLIFSVRSLRVNIWRYNPFSNLYLVASVVAGFIFTGLAVYFPPLQKLFGTVALPLPWVMGVIAFGLLNMFFAEIGKFVFKKSQAV